MILKIKMDSQKYPECPINKENIYAPFSYESYNTYKNGLIVYFLGS